MALVKLKKNQYIPFLDTAKDLTFAASTWKAIDLSTVFELTVGEVEEEMDYICYESAVNRNYFQQTRTSTEIALYQGMLFMIL